MTEKNLGLGLSKVLLISAVTIIATFGGIIVASEKAIPRAMIASIEGSRDMKITRSEEKLQEDASSGSYLFEGDKLKATDTPSKVSLLVLKDKRLMVVKFNEEEERTVLSLLQGDDPSIISRLFSGIKLAIFGNEDGSGSELGGIRDGQSIDPAPFISQEERPRQAASLTEPKETIGGSGGPGSLGKKSLKRSKARKGGGKKLDELSAMEDSIEDEPLFSEEQDAEAPLDIQPQYKVKSKRGGAMPLAELRLYFKDKAIAGELVAVKADGRTLLEEKVKSSGEVPFIDLDLTSFGLKAGSALSTHASGKEIAWYRVISKNHYEALVKLKKEAKKVSNKKLERALLLLAVQRLRDLAAPGSALPLLEKVVQLSGSSEKEDLKPLGSTLKEAVVKGP